MSLPFGGIFGFGLLFSKVNELLSLSIESRSTGGNRLLASSIARKSGAELGAGVESRAIKGSSVLGRKGDGLGRADLSCAVLAGLPRLIGVISGIAALSSTRGAE